MNNKLLVLGTIAYDSIESPSGSVKKILGGCATYIGLSASKFKTSCCLVSVVGEHPQHLDEVDKLIVKIATAKENLMVIEEIRDI